MLEFTHEEKVSILARIGMGKKELLSLKVASTDALRDAIEEEALVHERIIQKILDDLRGEKKSAQMSFEF